jgi:hypothetical protein
MSDRQARRIISDLEETGWIEAITKREGGRGKTTVYRINSKPKHGQKTRTSLCPPFDKKPGHFQHETRTSMTVNPDIAMSAEVFRSIKREVSSSSKTETASTLEEQTTDDGDQWAWEEIQRSYGGIDQGLRGQIVKALHNAEYNIGHLACYLRQNPLSNSWHTKAMGIRNCAIQLQSLSQGWTWPDCLRCADGGKLPNGAACTACGEAERKNERAEYITCPRCYGRGPDPRYEPCLLCQDAKTVHRLYAREWMKDSDFLECRACEGTGFQWLDEDHVNRRFCRACKGTGYVTQDVHDSQCADPLLRECKVLAGECPDCRRGTTIAGMLCPSCGGTGTADGQPPGPKLQRKQARDKAAAAEFTRRALKIAAEREAS